ncbi:hypothetical protein [Enterococcus thailandicus]|uniref:hypothetical protein n=1 Tax=Enterococcus thailandicus TaxID=417368 RepID=UPI0022E0E60F|nr:hypothetical protein [Enterococcus thailandicus]
MTRTFRIHKKDGTKVVEGESPLTITGISADTQVVAGDYYAVAIENEVESVKVDVPAFKTLAEQEPESLKTGLDEKPTKNNTIEEIKQWLTDHDIDFAGVTLKDDLLALMPA